LNRGFYTGIRGLNAQLNRMEVISNNLANVTTNGFKRRTAVVSSFHEMMLVNLNSNSMFPFPNEVGITHQGSHVTEVATDFSEGVYAMTNRMGDIAIVGEGFFTLQDENGNRFYTRNGQFFVEPDGYIRHGTGLQLLGEDGPIQIPEEQFSVSETGVVTSGETEIGRILITNFDDPNVLEKSGNSLYSAPEGVQGNPLEMPQLRQEFVERSNVDSTKEMIDAMEVLRAYEVGHKMVQAHDRLSDLVIREVGKIK